MEEKKKEFVFKLGCYTHSSDFRPSKGLPGISWDRNYVCKSYRADVPQSGTNEIHWVCPFCNEKLIISTPSRKAWMKNIILRTAAILAMLVIIILFMVVTKPPKGNDNMAALRIMGIFAGFIFVAFRLINVLSDSFGPEPKIKKSIGTKWWKHKLFAK